MLLDTCALLWLASGGKRLSRAVRTRIDLEPVVYVSSITGFEIGIKASSGKLHLPATPSDWFKAILDHHNLTVIPLDMDACLMAAALPLIHRDPCDRFIIATAKLNKLPVVTADKHFEQYGIEVIQAGP